MKSSVHITSGFAGTLLVLVISVMLSSGCAKTKAPEQLVFADPGNPVGSLIYIADAKGFFKDEDLTVTFKGFTSGRDAINSVLRSEADFAVASEFPFTNNILQGKALRILCTVQRTNQNAAVVGRVDRNILSAANLAGKRIGLATNTNSDYFLSVMLREAGIAENDAIRVAAKPEELPDLLEKGLVDAIATWAPLVSNARERFPSDQTVTLRTAAYTELGLVGVRQETVEQRSEALQRLVKALVRAEDFVSENSEAALQIVIKRFGDASEAALRKDWQGLQFPVRLDNVLLSMMSSEGEWLAKRANPPLVVPDFGATLVPAYLESVRAQSVTVTKKRGS